MPTTKTPPNPAAPINRTIPPGVTARRKKTSDPGPGAGAGARPRLRSVPLGEARLVDALPPAPDLPATAPDTPAAKAL